MAHDVTHPVSQKKVADDFDLYVESYRAQIEDVVAFSGMKPDFFIRAKCDYLKRLTARHLGENKNLNVLDLGCGIGAYHPFLSGVYGSLSGVDVSERSIEYARQANPDINYSVYPGGRLCYDDGAFDVAFTSCVMHHVPPPDWAQFASEMARVVRPGGLVVVFEHNPRNPLTQHIVRNCPMDADAVLLPIQQLRALFQNAGFADVKTRSILSIPPLVSPLYPVDETLGQLGLGAQYYLTGRKPG